MNLGFLVRCNSQGATFYQFGEGPAGAVAMFSAAGDDNLRAVFIGRLYYRTDLRQRLAEALRPRREACAAEYLLAAYRQGGADGLAWLEGDYAWVLWDAQNRRLLAARDPMGGLPLFWINDRGGVALSNAMRPLLDLLPRRTVNRDYLAEFLVLPSDSVQELHDERCAYEDVHRVMAGTRIEAGPQGTVRATRWWDWLSQIEEPDSLRPEDLAGRFGVLLNDSVQERRINRVAAHFSGGMDSTAVALLAARQAVAAGDQAVHALSLVYQRYSVLARETPYVDCALGGPGLEAHRLPGEDFPDFDDFRSDVNPDEPVVSVWQATSSRAMLDQAATLGAQTVMTGQGGDQVAMLLPYYLYELLRSGRWRTAWRESARWANFRSYNRWRYLGPFGLIYFLPTGLRTGLHCWWRQGRVSWERQREYTIAPWIRPEFARRFGLWPRALQWMRRGTRRCRPLAVSMGIEAVELNVGDAVRWELGVPRGLLSVRPFLDPRMIRFALGWQGKLWPYPERQKPILADAMRDVLPAAIRDRPGKGHFNQAYYDGLARSLALLESVVRRAPVDDLDLLDKEELLRCLHKAALGIGEDLGGADRLSLTLGVLRWLTTQQQAQAAPGPAIAPLGAGAFPLPVAGTRSAVADG